MRLSRILNIMLALIVGLTAMVGLASAQEPSSLALAEHGPYGVGVTTIIFVDESREDRELVTEVWYPAIVPEGEEAHEGGLRDAEPDISGAPYPLILYSQGAYFRSAGRTGKWVFLKTHLASHGFIVADASLEEDLLPTTFVHRPFDIVFLIEGFALITTGKLASIVNSQQVGVAGWGIGAYTALVTGGARVDPAYVDDYCGDPPPETRSQWLNLCNYTYPRQWNAVVAYRENLTPSPEIGALWPPVTDTRIRAVLSAQTPWSQVFGQQGLAAATTPTLFLGCVRDDQLSYGDVAFAYNHLGAEHKYFLSLLDAGHIYGDRSTIPFRPAITHFATAFFGYYLQGKEDYAEYLTADFVAQFEDLAWGPVETE